MERDAGQTVLGSDPVAATSLGVSHHLEPPLSYL